MQLEMVLFIGTAMLLVQRKLLQAHLSQPQPWLQQQRIISAIKQVFAVLKIHPLQ